MANPSSVSSGAAWQIKDLVDVTYNKVVLQLYPETSSDTPIGERAFAAMANKSALDGSTLTHEQRLVVFAKQVGLASWAQGPITDWQRALNRGWINFQANVSILDFQDSTGATMNHACLPMDPSLLKPVAPGAIADCRLADVKFA